MVSRERSRQVNADAAVSLETAAQETVRCQKVVAEDGQEVRLYCHSLGREQKAQAMAERFASRFETELNALNAGLQRPRTEKHPDKLWERIGRLKEKHHGIGQHYQIDLQTDDSGEKAVSITWQKHLVPGSLISRVSIACAATNANGRKNSYGSPI